MLIHDLFQEWLQHEAINKKPNTFLFYKNIVNYIVLSLANKEISKVTAKDCQNCINSLFKTFDYSKSTLKSVSVTMNRAFIYAKKNDYIKRNPASDIDIPAKAKTKDVTALSKKDQKILEEYCKFDKHGLLILFYLYSGLRSSELINLKWEDYNKNENTIKIEKSKTDAGIREIPLFLICRQIIDICPKRSKYIFTQSNGKQITKSVLRKTYLRIRRETGIQAVTIHVLRHSFATRLLENKVEMKAISLFLGHSSEYFTSKTYTHPDICYLKSEMDNIGAQTSLNNL